MNDTIAPQARQRQPWMEISFEETLEALHESENKWAGIVAGEVKDEGRDNCALCQRFNPEETQVMQALPACRRLPASVFGLPMATVATA